MSTETTLEALAAGFAVLTRRMKNAEGFDGVAIGGIAENRQAIHNLSEELQVVVGDLYDLNRKAARMHEELAAHLAEHARALAEHIKTCPGHPEKGTAP